VRDRRGKHLARTAKQLVCELSSREGGLLVAADVLALPVCNDPDVVSLITLDVPAGGVLLLETPGRAFLRGACIGLGICRFPL
jgi:hypothetical protein